MARGFDAACPYCEAPGAELVDDGQLLRCRECGRSGLPSHRGQPSPNALSAARRLTRPVQGTRPRGAPGEGRDLGAAAAGLGITLVFYLLLRLFPDSMLYELFTQRGWVPIAITAISAWALCLLVAKLLRLRREAAVLAFELIAPADPTRLGPDETESLLEKLRAMPPQISESFLAARLERALRHFSARRRVVEVVDFLAAEAQADDLRVDASYSLVRVFVWAVPTLGFIGTVIGIGGAVGGFSDTLEAASSIEGMKASIGSVTGGLGVAFDTTLLALVMSILIMFPANAVQRIEEGLLSAIDDYCAEHLVQRLQDSESANAEGLDDERLLDALTARIVAALRNGEGR